MTFSEADYGVRLDRPRRRVFSLEYKLAILEEYYRLTETGAKVALLRREGLYSSHIGDWRRARDAGTLVEVTDSPRPDSDPAPASPATARRKPRQRKGNKPTPGKAKTTTPPTGNPAGEPATQRDNERLAKENQRLTEELARTKAALDIMGKAHALLAALSESADTDPKQSE